MSSYDCLLAALLLTGNADTPAAPVEAAWADECLPALLALALDAQVLDVREQKNYFTTSACTTADLQALRRRFHDFAFLPMIEEGTRFPERKVTGEFLAFNRAYRRDLQQRLDLDAAHALHLKVILAEAEQLYAIWTAVYDARCEYYYVTVRREALRRLRDLIGAPAFYAGALPPYVPTWRFPVER
ncbi:MAG: hypothetical protein NZO58_11835 [Gemmataceae bacterium]|nr:hypothetical protein [Gemmataceae bacterium]